MKPPTATLDAASLELSPQNFARFAQLVKEQLGIQMPAAKNVMLQSRLTRRIRELGLGSLDEYRDLLFHSPEGGEELVHFINAVTTNKTDFYREPRHFDYLVQVALPQLYLRYGTRAAYKCALWSAGCSSGEEPYTLAMVMAEQMEKRPGFAYSILATDISTRVLDHARSAIYEEARVEPLPEEMRRKYVLRSKDASRQLVRIAPELRQRVAFRRLNFMDDHYGTRENFDVIFIRNVMIYFDKPTQEAVLNKLVRNLKPGAYLFLGHSESLASLDVPVRQVAPAVFQKEG